MRYIVVSSADGRTHKITGTLRGVTFTRIYLALSREEAVKQFLAVYSLNAKDE